MPRKRVMVNIDTDLNDRWGKVAKKHQISKSSMIEDFLKQVVPILEEKTNERMMAKAMKEMGKTIELTGSLFDDK